MKTNKNGLVNTRRRHWERYRSWEHFFRTFEKKITPKIPPKFLIYFFYVPKILRELYVNYALSKKFFNITIVSFI